MENKEGGMGKQSLYKSSVENNKRLGEEVNAFGNQALDGELQREGRKIKSRGRRRYGPRAEWKCPGVRERKPLLMWSVQNEGERLEKQKQVKVKAEVKVRQSKVTSC